MKLTTAAPKPRPSETEIVIDIGRESNLIESLFLSSRACLSLLNLAGRIVAINPSFRALMELDGFAAVDGLPWTTFWPQDAQVLVEQGLHAARNGRTAGFTAFCPTTKGAPRWWDVSITPVLGEDRAVIFILVSSTDVTHTKEREAKLEAQVRDQQNALVSLAQQLDSETRRLAEAQQRVSHAEKLHLLGQFVGTVVHDINNVLAVMQSAARILRRRYAAVVDVEILNQVDQSVHNGKALVRRLLDLSRPDPPAAEVFCISDYMASQSDLMRRLLGEQHRLVLQPGEDVSPILIEPQKFQSVIFNLLANARDALDEGGEVRIAWRNCPAKERPAGLAPDDYVCVEIADNGGGMPPEVLARVGEPFFTTKGVGRGTGLGVASAFDLAARCKGRVVIASEPGKGSSFSLYFPRSAVRGEACLAPGTDLAEAKKHGNATILVVENDQLVRAHIASALRTLGYMVLEASSEVQAIASVLQQVRLDLVIADLHLGGGNGMRLAHRLRVDRPELPVFFVTGTPESDWPLGERIFHKPIDEKRLAQATLEALGRAPASSLNGAALRHADEVRYKLRNEAMGKVLDLWRLRCREIRRLPSTSDAHHFDIEIRANSYLVAVMGGETFPRFQFLYAGEALAEKLGRPLLNEVINPGDENVLGGSGRAFQECLAGRPYFDRVRYGPDGGRALIFDRLLTPLSDDGKRVTHLLGVATFQEVSSDA